MLSRFIFVVTCVPYALALNGGVPEFFFNNFKPAPTPSAPAPRRPVAVYPIEKVPEDGVNHGFFASAYRTYRLVTNGKARTIKTMAVDVVSRHEELVFLSAEQAVGDAPNVDVVQEVVVVQEIDQDPRPVQTQDGIVQNIVETVRDAFDQYLSPYLGGTTASDIQNRARDALRWIGDSWWKNATPFQASILRRLAILKVDRVTGQTLILNAPSVEVKVVRVGKIVFEASQAALDTETINTIPITVSEFIFEIGDIVVVASKKWWESIPLDKVLEVLTFNAKLTVIASNIVKLVPKDADEINFALGLFE